MEALSLEEKIALSDVRWEKSGLMLHDAVKNFDAGMYRTSVNRAYYSALHSARSLLILKGIDPASRDGVQTMFSLHFIKPGLINVDMIRIFKGLQTLRTDVDYGDFESVNKSDAEKAIRQAKKFGLSLHSNTVFPGRPSTTADCF